jgi:hypothetical protein
MRLLKEVNGGPVEGGGEEDEEEACTLDDIFVNVGVRSSVSGGLGWLLEHSAAPATWPS